jgi:hypothetical protein
LSRLYCTVKVRILWFWFSKIQKGFQQLLTNGHKCISHFFALKLNRHNGSEWSFVSGLVKNGDFVQVDKAAKGKDVDVKILVSSFYRRSLIWKNQLLNLDNS